MLEIDYKSGKFLIKCSPDLNDLVMSMPERRFRKGTKVWAAPALRRNVEYMERHMNNRGHYTDQAYSEYMRIRNDNARAPGDEGGFPPDWEFKCYQPMGHQVDALRKYFPLNEAALFFEQGLGKTFTSINLAAAWAACGKIDAVLVICPASIKLVWENELEKLCPLPYTSHSIRPSNKRATEKFITTQSFDLPWLIMGVEALSQGSAYKLAQRYCTFRRVAIIVDESSTIKNHKATRTDKCISLGKLAKKRVILSGTSITNGIEDLYSQFQFLNADILGFHSYYSFRNHYCQTFDMEVADNKWVTKITGYKNEDELLRLVRPYATRVEKRDVLDLPEKVFMDRMVKMGPAQRQIYNEMAEKLRSYVEGSEYEVTSVLEQMMRLQQITGGHYPHDDGETVSARRIPGSNTKITELKQVLAETSGKVVIFCRFRPEIDDIAEELDHLEVDYVVFHGGRTDEEKKQAVDRFQNGGAMVFLASKAAARGLTLHAASDMIYYSQDYNLDDYSQSQDRIHRIGQDMGCTYTHLLCEDSIDVNVIRALRDKQSIADLVYGMLKS